MGAVPLSRGFWLFLFTVGSSFFASVGAIAPEPQLLRERVTVSQALGCDQVYRIAEWSLGRYGGPGNTQWQQKEFSQRALSRFLEKSDPQKLLFTRSEADAFLRQGSKAWDALLKRQECAFFLSFGTEVFAKARERFERNLKALPVESYFKARAEDGLDLSEVKSPAPAAFAANEPELAERLARWVKQLASHATPGLLAAYHQDRRALVADILRQTFFSEPLEPGALLAKSVLGALDPYSTYFTASEFDDFYEDLAGGTSGIGIKVREVPDGFLIERVLKGTPAGKSRKLKVGDIITEVDGKRPSSMSHELAKKLLKGPESSEVRLRVSRGKAKTFALVLKRERFAFDEAKIHSRWMAARRGSRPVAVIDIPSFYGRGGMDPLDEQRSSSEDLAAILRQVKEKKPSAVVLDLRGNPGGFLEESVAMAGLFLGDKPVVEVVEKKERRVLRDFHHPEPLYNGPLVVLIDEGTASASEVLAGALKDYGRAVVVGSARSYGKGLVQRLFHLDQELFPLAPAEKTGVVKLTTSVYYSPSGHTPANGGIQSHIALPEPKEPVETAAALPPIAEELPFREATGAGEFSIREELLKKNLVELSQKSQARTHSAVKDGLSDEQELKEAVSIALDYSDLERRMAPQVANRKGELAR